MHVYNIDTESSCVGHHVNLWLLENTKSCKTLTHERTQSCIHTRNAHMNDNMQYITFWCILTMMIGMPKRNSVFRLSKNLQTSRQFSILLHIKRQQHWYFTDSFWLAYFFTSLFLFYSVFFNLFRLVYAFTHVVEQ